METTATATQEISVNAFQCQNCDAFPYDTQADLDAHVASGNCAVVNAGRHTYGRVLDTTGSGRFETVANGFGGTTTRKVEAPKPQPVRAQAPEISYDEALGRTMAWMRDRFADRKLDVADVTPKLQWLAEQYARRYHGSGPVAFQFMEDMNEAAQKWGKLTPGQAKGVLNCIRADALRSTPTAPAATPAGLDLSKLPESAHGILRVAITDDDGVVVFLQICQKRHSGIVVLQEVGGNEPLFLGGQRTGQAYRGKRVAELEKVVADPQAAVLAYGRHFTTCGVCGTQLTDSHSIEAGIGPKCAARVGW